MLTDHATTGRALAGALALAAALLAAAPLAATPLAAAPLAATPLAATPAAAQESHQGHAMPGTASGGTAADRALEAAMRRMHETTPMKGTGRPDHDFVTMMIPHHQGAIDMARVELEHGKDPALQDLARAVVTDQEKEIATMREWLAKHPK